MANDIIPPKDRVQNEAENFATNFNSNIIRRVEDEASIDAQKLITLEANALSEIRAIIGFPRDKTCRRIETGAIYYDFYLDEVLEETFKITIGTDYDWCVEQIGAVLQEDGFYLLQEDDSQILRE